MEILSHPDIHHLVDERTSVGVPVARYADLIVPSQHGVTMMARLIRKGLIRSDAQSVTTAIGKRVTYFWFGLTPDQVIRKLQEVKLPVQKNPRVRARMLANLLPTFFRTFHPYETFEVPRTIDALRAFVASPQSSVKGLHGQYRTRLGKLLQRSEFVDADYQSALDLLRVQQVMEL